MKNAIYTHTDTRSPTYPGYINISVELGIVNVSVRSGGGAGISRGSFITLTRAELAEMGTAIEKYLIDTEPAPAPTPAKGK